MNITDCIYYTATPSSTYVQGMYRTSTIGTSDCNSLIPFHSLSAHDLITFKDSDAKVLEYAIPSVTGSMSHIRNFTHFFSYLKHASGVVRFNYTLQGVAHHIFVGKGIILDDQGDILVCVGIDTQYALTTPYVELKDKPDYTKYMLFISKKIEDPKYKNLKKRLERDYFSTFLQNDIDILQTNRIVSQWLFKNNLVKPVFKSVKEANKHLKEEVPKLLLEV